MKKLSVYSFAVLLIAAVSYITTEAQAGNSVRMKRNVYVGDCQYEAPLTTWDRCDDRSYTGHSARECAENAAMRNCHADYNSDCILVSSTARAFTSTEFVGYKLCKAVARVHGYEVQP